MRILIDGQLFSTPDVDRGIGRVTVGLCRAMIPYDTSKEWFIAVDEHADLSPLGAEVARHTTRVEVALPDAAESFEVRTERYSETLRSVCESHEIDLYWNPDPLMLNVVLPTGLAGVRRVCTVYDVIPARMRENYLDRWPEAVREEYERRLRLLPAWTDHLAFISQASLADYAELEGAAIGVSTVIPIGIDHDHFAASVAPAPAAQPPYVLLVGGGDARKNMNRAIAAFGALAVRFPDLLLKIACSLDERTRTGLEEQARGARVGDRVRCLGYVSDADLARLYREASALLFPSLYEGFGLPVVEAMACGCPVVLSERPEFRECAGPIGFYCDPHDVSDIANQLQRALCEPRPDKKERRRASVRAASRYRWPRSARDYTELFESLMDRASVAVGSQPLRVAWVSPWPPDRSGVADYSKELLAHLRKSVEVEVFAERPLGALSVEGLPVRPLARLKAERRRFDSVIYHLGNNSEFHREIYQRAWEDPGIVVLHDLNLHPFLQYAYLGTPLETLYRDALVESHGEPGREHFLAVKSGRCDPDFWAFPASEAVARRSLATIVHSAHGRRMLGRAADVFVVPLGTTAREPINHERRAEIRRSLGLRDGSSVVGVFGFLNIHKRIGSIVDACARMRRRGYPVDLLLVGEVNDARLDVDQLLAELDARAFVHRLGFVCEERFWECMDAVDVVVNLRHPTMGESSATLLGALGSGRPCLVSDVQSFAELPDAVCWKVRIDDAEVDELVLYLEKLMQEPHLREQMGSNARNYVVNHSSYESAAALYEFVVREAVGG